MKIIFKYNKVDSVDTLKIDFKGLEISCLQANTNDIITSVDWSEDKLFIPTSCLKPDEINEVLIEYTNNFSKTSLGL